MTSEESFDALLGDLLAPPARPADGVFVARIQAAVAETERFRRWRRRAMRQVGSEALVLAALAGAGLTLANAPLPQALLEQVPFVAPAAVGALALLWLALSPKRSPVLA